MTATAFVRSDPKPAPERGPDSAASACRRLWATVVLAAMSDWWHATARAKGDPEAIARIHADAMRYFRSRDGREVAHLAGITTDPERLAAIAIDVTARKRTIRREDDA